jgi:para-nitrobenzyl esterase
MKRMNDANNSVQVNVKGGALRGTVVDGVSRFLGIPYAEAPVGSLRFRPPVPAAPWDGERDATVAARVCPQNPSLLDALVGTEPEPWDEDCLYLNVWAPNPIPESPLPVMVWIHGGGFEMGSGTAAVYDGRRFAQAGVVLVTLNYRLGALGFLELGGVNAEYAGSGNNGIRDQVAALEWVRDNIASFGGDPSNVTVFGQSAGAMSVALLMAMPMAHGLFRRAIVQSGSTEAARSPELAAADTAEYMSQGAWNTLEELLAAAPEELLAAHAAMAASRFADPESFIRRTGNPLAFLSFRPVADGLDIPLDPLGAINSGSADGVDLLVGTTSEEWKMFAMMTPGAQTEEDLLRRLDLLVDDHHGALQAYREEFPSLSVAELEGAMLTDLVFRVPALRLAEAQSQFAPAYQYLWTWKSLGLGGMIGASHAIEIPFVFDVVDDPRLVTVLGDAIPESLGHLTNSAWVAFARSGVPTGEDLGEWPTVSAEGWPVMVLDTKPVLVHNPHAITRAFWDAER